MTEGPRVVEPAADLDLANPNASAWNRASVGMIDCPNEVELTAAAILAITIAEQVALTEYVRYLTLE